MILVSIESNMLVLECVAGIASSVLHALNPFCPNVSRNAKGNCVIKLSLEQIDEINKALGPFSKSIILDKSFEDWKASNIAKKPLLIRCGVVFSVIYKSSDYDIPHKDIEDATKYFFKPAVNQKAYKDKKWDGYIHLYKRLQRRFPTGLLDRVLEVLDKQEIPYKLEYTYEQKPAKQFDWQPRNLFQLSEDQVLCINECMDAGRCVVKAATGFGKTSALARYLTAYHGVPTLFIANKKVLLDDAAKDFKEGIDGLEDGDIAQIKDGWFGGINLRKTDSFDYEDILSELGKRKIVVATIQSLKARLEDQRTSMALRTWLKDYCKFLMVDETQAVGTAVWDEVLALIEAPYRVFLSATPKRVDGATLKIFAYAGPLVFDTSADEQIAKGRLCELDIQYWPFDHQMYNDNDTELVYNEIYQECIVNNTARNRFIVERTLEMLDEERQVLVLIQYIEHGHLLKEMFLENGLEASDIRFIWGDTPDKLRQEAINGFRRNEFKVLIGSTVADAGLNIPSISGVVLAGAGNSDITHIQRIGRGSRTFDYEKNFGFIPRFIRDAGGVKITRVIDILDHNIAFFKKQAKNRYYNASEEFGADRVHIVGADRSIFRYRSKAKQDLSKVDDEKAINDMFSAFKGIDREQIENTKSDKNDAVDDFLSAWKRV